MSRKRDHEAAIFEAFLELAPEFAGERLKEWHQPALENDFPDISATSVSGHRIGVELGEWLNEKEIQSAKQKERTEEEILGVIGDQGRNPTANIRFVWLHPKPQTRIAAKDRVAFRDELLACLEDCDKRWPNERYWKPGHLVEKTELEPYTKLAKYLDAIKLWPAEGRERWEHNWITFPALIHIFDRDTMFRPLRAIVEEKIGRYGARTGYDDLSLLVFYNQAALFNSPAESPFHSYEDAVARLKDLLGDNRGPFDRVFLYLALAEPHGRVFTITGPNGSQVVDVDAISG